MPTPVHIVAGFLGAGKTTTVRAWMQAHAGRERAAIIVNDFGEAGIDGALLGQSLENALPGDVPVVNIPGGCVCCTAPAGLARAVATVLDEVRPDRLFIEPSGLARPQDVVDMLTRGGLRDRVALGPTVVVVDPTAPAAGALLDTQLEAADVLVLNRVDLAPAEGLAAFRARVATMWPGPVRTIETTWGRLPEDALDWPEGAGPRVRYTVARDAPSTEGYRARSWIFPAEARFAWDKLRDLLVGAPGVARFKGLFATDVGWIRVDIAGGRLQMDATPWRRDSRADLIVTGEADLDAFAVAIDACRVSEDVDPVVPGVTLVDLDGFELHLAREGLAALSGQVPDVGVHVPGRAGAAVPLREVLALAAAPPGARFVVSATDGMTSAPALVSGVGDAFLVHSLAGGPLPGDQGGPFRLLVRPDAPKSACAAVKGVARIRLLPAE